MDCKRVFNIHSPVFALSVQAEFDATDYENIPPFWSVLRCDGSSSENMWTKKTLLKDLRYDALGYVLSKFNKLRIRYVEVPVLTNMRPLIKDDVLTWRIYPSDRVGRVDVAVP